MDELSQLDELIESDILEALGQDLPENIEKEESINIEDLENEEEITLEDLEEQVDLTPEIKRHTESSLCEEAGNVSIPKNDVAQKIETTINTADLGSLLSQLLANKTIEITIKIKD